MKLQFYDEKSKTVELNPRKRIKGRFLTIMFKSHHVNNVSCTVDYAHLDPVIVEVVLWFGYTFFDKLLS